jgi:hypothetical protein
LDELVRPLLRDADLQVRVAAAETLWHLLKGQAGDGVTQVAIESLPSAAAGSPLSAPQMLEILRHASQDPNDPQRVTAASFGTAATNVIAGLIELAATTQAQDVKAAALGLLDKLAPEFRPQSPKMDSVLGEQEQLNAFVERVRSGWATGPELMEGLKRFPRMSSPVSKALVALGPEARAMLPSLREYLKTFDARDDANRGRETIANAIQTISPDQPKPLFASEDVSSVIGMWIGQSDRWPDKERGARIAAALNPARRYLMAHGHQMPPDEMQKILEALKATDQPAYETALAEVKKIDPQFLTTPER